MRGGELSLLCAAGGAGNARVEQFAPRGHDGEALHRANGGSLHGKLALRFTLTPQRSHFFDEDW